MLLRLLILNSLIYANTYNTKAENTLHSTSTDRCATRVLEKNKNYERVKLLGKVIAAIGVGCFLYYLWSTSPLGDYLEKVPIVYGNPSVICIKRKRYEVLPWDKTIYYFSAKDRRGDCLYMPCQYKVTLGGKKYLCKEFSSYKELEIYQRLNETGAVPKIIKCYQLHSFLKKKECLCIMEYPSPIEGPIERINACIDGLKKFNEKIKEEYNRDLKEKIEEEYNRDLKEKIEEEYNRDLNEELNEKINEKIIEYTGITPCDMVEHCFMFNCLVSEWFHDFYSRDKYDKKREKKKQIMSLARSVLADEYRREIRELLDQKSSITRNNEYPYPHAMYLPKLLTFYPYISEGENELDILSKRVKEIIGKNKEKSEQKANYEEQRIKLLSVLVKAGKGEIETLEDFFRQISLQVGVGEDTAEKILSYYWRRKVDKKKINDINDIIVKYCN